MLVDANILVYAVNTAAPEHQRSVAWLEERLNGDRRVGFPWESLLAFVRIVTNPRGVDRPMSPADAWDTVEAWLASRPEEAERIFAGLSEGGAKITMPMAETFWSPRFGMLVDRFGTNWMVGAEQPADKMNCG